MLYPKKSKRKNDNDKNDKNIIVFQKYDNYNIYYVRIYIFLFMN